MWYLWQRAEVIKKKRKLRLTRLLSEQRQMCIRDRLTNEVMKSADIILATGGPGMVKAAYSSGKPALGVGAGNTPVIIDDTADVKMAVNSIIHSKTFDNGMICASEQSVTVLEKVYKEMCIRDRLYSV